MNIGFNVEMHCSRCGHWGKAWVSAALLRLPGESKERLIVGTVEKVEMTPPPYWVAIEGQDAVLCENCK